MSRTVSCLGPFFPLAPFLRSLSAFFPSLTRNIVIASNTLRTFHSPFLCGAVPSLLSRGSRAGRLHQAGPECCGAETVRRRGGVRPEAGRGVFRPKAGQGVAAGRGCRRTGRRTSAGPRHKWAPRTTPPEEAVGAGLPVGLRHDSTASPSSYSAWERSRHGDSSGLMMLSDPVEVVPDALSIPVTPPPPLSRARPPEGARDGVKGRARGQAPRGPGSGRALRGVRGSPRTSCHK